MTPATRDEWMTVAAARMLWDRCVCFVGIGLPSAACNLARLTHAPDIVLIYESGTIGTRPDVLPHWIVTAVAHCPGGAYPSYVQDHYSRDNAFYQRWDAIARDRETFRAWMDEHVLGCRDHAAFLARLRTAA